MFSNTNNNTINNNINTNSNTNSKTNNKNNRRLWLVLSSQLILASAFTLLLGGSDGWFHRRACLVLLSHPRFRLYFPPGWT
ncbi:hypothetical protein DPMN_118119 [Dreissena polymorpha]|uniref:Uncharacterized protein n=1 Tax=Dreissena polymorpha TaxID=45954 RepID=A0A9D4GFV0_DREPO|nr:hypothetical protein DPMN_118119 [Dreissena polymorpha]